MAGAAGGWGHDLPKIWVGESQCISHTTGSYTWITVIVKPKLLAFSEAMVYFVRLCQYSFLQLTWR